MALEWITFHVTDRCQLDCEHCLRDPARKPTDLPVELISRVLREAKQLYQSEHTAFTGGEPTLHPDFLKLVDAAVEEGYTWHMVTNGRRFAALATELGPRRLGALTAVNLSLDGATEEVHDGIRGKDSYCTVMAAASACTAMGIKFVLNCTLHARNTHEIEAMGMLASQLGAAGLSFVMMQPTGTHHDAGFYLSSQAWRRVMDRIHRLRAALTLPVTMPEGFHREQPFHVCTPFTQQQIHIDVHARLNLCCQHSGIPSDGEPRDIVADLNHVGLPEAHEGLVGLIHRVQRDKLAAIRRGGLTEWDHFPCNHCMKSFGKPHWTDDGVGGAVAKRERWGGASERKNHSLPLLR